MRSRCPDNIIASKP